MTVEREGTVERKTVAEGSKSERDAVVLHGAEHGQTMIMESWEEV